MNLKMYVFVSSIKFPILVLVTPIVIFDVEVEIVFYPLTFLIVALDPHSFS